MWFKRMKVSLYKGKRKGKRLAEKIKSLVFNKDVFEVFDFDPQKHMERIRSLSWRWKYLMIFKSPIYMELKNLIIHITQLFYKIPALYVVFITKNNLLLMGLCPSILFAIIEIPITLALCYSQESFFLTNFLTILTKYLYALNSFRPFGWPIYIYLYIYLFCQDLIEP